MALRARAWIGKSIDSVVLGAVSLFPSQPRAATLRSARKRATVGWRPALAVSESQAPRSSWRLVWPVRTKRMSPSPTVTPWLRSAVLEVLGEHVLAGLEPGNLPEAGHVEQHPAPDQAAPEHIDCILGRPPRGHRRARPPVVEATIERNVTERVDVTVGGVVVVGPDEVLGELQGTGLGRIVGEQRHVMVNRSRVVDPNLRVERQAERDRLTASDQPCRRSHAFGAQIVERSTLVVGSPAPPARDRLEQLTELGEGEVLLRAFHAGGHYRRHQVTAIEKLAS